MSAAAWSCRPRFSPQRFWNLVPTTVVQETLRSVFSRWGRPQRLRVDNGTPWGSAGDWPTELALWLIGLGVVMMWNPPRSPQDNGVVERSQGTGKRWTEPGTCKDADELQRRIDYMDRIQREVYPNPEGKSRLQAFPDVHQVPRPYRKTWEQRHWDLQLVLTHLAEYNAVRRVGCSGQVSVYGRDHYVGKKYRGQDIYVFLDPVAREWVFATPAGTQLCRKVAEELTRERIIKLQVSHRHC
jgi:transposase InsO family protein